MKVYVREMKTRTAMPPFDGPVIATMPLKKNVPYPNHDDWELGTCPECGRECWRMGETSKLAQIIYPGIRFLCTECALLQGSRKEPNQL